MEHITLTCKFAIYVDFTSEEIPRAFYVGKGTEWRCNDRRSRNQIYRHIREKYGPMKRQILFETHDEIEAFSKEKELILKFKTFVRGGEEWWGANCDLGGKGGVSTPKTLEHRQKIAAANKGKSKSIEHRQKLAAAHSGKILTSEHCQKISDALKRHWSSKMELEPVPHQR